MNLGQSIKKLRTDIYPDMAQYQFAEKIGVNQAYFSCIEKGKKRPSLEILEKIAIELSIPLPILFWFGVSKDDISSEKTEAFRILKPVIDKMFEMIY